MKRKETRASMRKQRKIDRFLSFFLPTCSSASPIVFSALPFITAITFHNCFLIRKWQIIRDLEHACFCPNLRLLCLTHFILYSQSWFMEKTDFSVFGPLLHKYGVDLHLCGHAHNYQRLYPSKWPCKILFMVRECLDWKNQTTKQTRKQH